MTIAIIIIAYVLNIFLNRWLNKIAYKLDDYNKPNVFSWFIPISPTLFYLILIIGDTEYKTNWFTGKNWK
jgi:hypothetical protein